MMLQRTNLLARMDSASVRRCFLKRAVSRCTNKKFRDERTQTENAFELLCYEEKQSKEMSGQLTVGN